MESRWVYTMIIAVLLVLPVIPAGASVTAVTSTHNTIVKGDRVLLNGTNAMNGTYGIWVVGRNYFDVKTVTPDKKGTFTYIIKGDETARYSSGQYAILIQDPGANQNLEIEPLYWSDGIKIANRGKIVDEIGLKENLRANVAPAVKTILDATGKSVTDDTFSVSWYYVEEPFIRFNILADREKEVRLPDQTTGEEIAISGTTNAGVENTLRVGIYDLASGSLVTAKAVPVMKGDSSNKWTYTLASPGLQPGEYYISVGWGKTNTTGIGTALLSIRESRIVPVEHTRPVPVPAEYNPDVFYPLIISGGALVLIGIIMVVSLKK